MDDDRLAAHEKYDGHLSRHFFSFCFAFKKSKPPIATMISPNKNNFCFVSLVLNLRLDSHRLHQ